MTRRLFLLASLALGGCATVGVTPAGPPAPLAELEPLYSAVSDRDGLKIQVNSNGCTAKGDFAFYVERRGGAASVAFARRRVDACKSFAIGRTEIAFSWAELGLEPRAPVFLLNPLTAWTGPGV
jgi:hypothetical protein